MIEEKLNEKIDVLAQFLLKVSRERGILISEFVELVQEYDELKKEAMEAF
jgi:hypothetical protein